MHTKKALVLLVVVAALAALITFRGNDAPRSSLVPLVPDLDLGSVRALQLENRERATTLRLERDDRGGWFLTDPIAYRADPSAVDALLRVLSTNTCYPVTDRSPAQVSLDPPRALLEVTQLRDGEERSSVVALGATDLGGGDVYVGIDGKIYLTLRSLESVLELPVHHYREKRLLTLPERSVTSVERAGWLPLRSGSGARDLTFSAQRTEEGWQLARPFAARLDSQAMAVLVRATLSLRAAAFIDDDPEQRLALYGLDEPHFEVGLGLASGTQQTLRVGTEPRPAGGLGPWRAMRAGHPHVFEIDNDAALALGVELENLLDYRFARAEAADVAEVEWSGAAGTVRLVREETGWRVLPRGDERHRRPDGRADPDAVAEWLADVLSTELDEYLPEESFAHADASRTLSIRTVDGRVLGGSFGEARGRSRLFRAYGDEIPSLAPASLYERTEANADAFWESEIHRLDRLVQVRIEVRRGDRELVFVRDRDNGLWYLDGEEVSIATGTVLDDLQTIRALAWVGEERAAPLSDEVRVSIVPVAGPPVVVILGRAPGAPREEAAALGDGTQHVQCQSAAGRAEVESDKLTGAWKLFEG